MKYPAYTPAPLKRRSSDSFRGFSLLTSLVILLLLTILMVAMVRSAISQDTMTGNAREKARALHAAQTAMNYAEWWIKKNNELPVVCNNGKLSQPAICKGSVTVQNAEPPLSTWTDYQPSSSTTYWQTNNQGGSGTFYRNPGYHIQHLYVSPDGKADYYQITAYGYGGNNQAVAVIQNLFQISYSGNQVNNLGG